MSASVPTHLEDLRATDARVRFRCASCGHEEVHDRELLIRSMDWRSTTELSGLKLGCRLPCPEWLRCADAVPWSEGPVQLRRRVAMNTLLNLACKVLKGSAYARAPKAEQQPPVRLALRLVRTFGVETKTSIAYWTKVTAEHPSPWDGCHNEFNWIVQALVERGWGICAEFR